MGTILYSDIKEIDSVPYADYIIGSMEELPLEIVNFSY
jgi:hypothetical protein